MTSLPSPRRAALIVLDSAGCGSAPDAGEYGGNSPDGDVGANTIAHTLTATGTSLPNLRRAGLFNLASLRDVPANPPVDAPEAYCARLMELSPGKDTTTGHFELAGVALDRPFPTYPGGLPRDMLAEFSRRIGTGLLGDGKHASGTEIIQRLGEEHIRTGFPIVYSSADSVFQLAADERTFGLRRLYDICAEARAMLTGEWNIGRVIARPFTANPAFGENGEPEFIRTANRRDYSVEPPGVTILDRLAASGRQVLGVGKIHDIFAGRSVTQNWHTDNNTEGIEKIIGLMDSDACGCLRQPPSASGGLIFANLVDFDMLYGHRRDPRGYSAALAGFDAALPRILRRGWAVLITADHGCDPTFPGTDHTREYVPLVAYGIGRTGTGDGLRGFTAVNDILADYFGLN